jgi:hypothetical protein
MQKFIKLEPRSEAHRSRKSLNGKTTVETNPQYPSIKGPDLHSRNLALSDSKRNGNG